MSLRWPLKSTRGFSATPRRGSGSRSMTVPQTPKPSRSFARRVVRAAGPQERAFFTNSTLVSAGTLPNTFMNAAVIRSTNTFVLFGPTDYGTEIGSRERIRIRRLDAVLHMYVSAGSSNMPFHAAGLAFLALGTEDDIDQNTTGPDQWPFGTQGEVVGFSDVNPKVVRYKARRILNRYIPGSDFQDPGTDANTSSLAYMRMPMYQRIKLTVRNAWLREPEQVELVLTHIKRPMQLGEDPNTSGGVFGWIETYCTYSKF